jgi:hypothetical protein
MEWRGQRHEPSVRAAVARRPGVLTDENVELSADSVADTADTVCLAPLDHARGRAGHSFIRAVSDLR